jgi:AcrR family transcriptional regulator
MSTVQQVRRGLYYYFDDKAETLIEIAAREPKRASQLLQTAENLRRIADYVGTLTDDNPLLLAFLRPQHPNFTMFVEESFLPPRASYGTGVESRSDEAANDCGMGSPVTAPDKWFKWWCGVVAEECGDSEWWLEFGS